MLIRIGRQIINADLLTQIVESDTRGRVDVYMAGQDEPLSVAAGLDYLERYCGRLIQAPAGYSLMLVSLDDADTPPLVRELPVIAFIYESGMDLMPVTVEGRADVGGAEHWALLHPDGHLTTVDACYEDKARAIAAIAEAATPRRRAGIAKG